MIRLGDINFGLGADTRGLRKSTKDLLDFGDQVERAAKRTSKGSKAIANDLIRQERAALDALKRMQQFNNTARNVGAPSRLITESRQAFARLSAEMVSGRLKTLDFSRAQKAFDADLARVSRSLARWKAKADESKDSSRMLSEFLKDLSTSATLALGPLSGLGARITALTSIFNRSTALIAAFVVGMTAATVVLGGITHGAIKAGYELDKINARLQVSAGNSLAAAKEYDYLWQMANRLGLEFAPLVNQFTRLETASAGTSLEGEKTRQIFEAVAGAAAKLRLPGTEVEGVLRAIEQMMSKGQVQAEELRNQLGDRLPGAFQIAARAMGMTTLELNKQLKAGKVLSEDFLPKFAAELTKLTRISAGQKIDSLQGATNRLSNSIFAFNKAVDESQGISNAWKSVLEITSSVVDSVANHINGLIAAITGLGVGLTILALPRIIALFVTLSNVVKTAAVSMLALNAATLANPLVAITAAIARVTIVLGSATAAYYYMENAQNTVNNSTQALITSTKDYIEAQKTGMRLQSSITSQRIKDIQNQIAAEGLLVEALKNRQEVEWTMGAPEDFMNGFVDAQQQKIQNKIDESLRNINILRDQAGQLDTILKDQLKAESNVGNNKPGLSDKEIREAQRRAESISEAYDKIRNAQLQLEQGYANPVVAENIQNLIKRREAVDQMHDALVRAKVGQETINQLTQRYSDLLTELDSKSKLFEQISDLYTLWSDSISNALNSVTGSLVDLAITGEASIKDFRKAFREMAADIIKQIINILVWKPLLQGLMGGLSTGPSGPPINLLASRPDLYSANGNAFMPAGSVTNVPSTLSIGSGNRTTGIAENGQSEGIFPLIRDSSGRMGVSAVGSGGNQPIYVQPIIRIIDQNNSQVSQSSYNEGGQEVWEFMIEPMNKAINSGSLDGALSARTGGKPRTVRRGFG